MASNPFVSGVLASGVDLSADFTSVAADVPQNLVIALDIDFTGDPVGEFIVEASNDGDGWQALEFGQGKPLAAGAAEVHNVVLAYFAFRFLRVRFVRSSGSGRLDIRIHGKG